MPRPRLPDRPPVPAAPVRARPAAAAATVGLVGDLDAVRARIDDHARTGLDEIALVPATDGDPAGQRTLTALRPA